MGFSAFVKCNCFIEEKTSSDPPYNEFIKEDEEGLFLELDWETNQVQHAEFDQWKEFEACIHPNMEVASEFIGNVSTMAKLKALVGNSEGRDYPLLHQNLPNSNSGSIGASIALEMKEELLKLRKQIDCKSVHLIDKLLNLTNASIETGNPIVWC